MQCIMSLAHFFLGQYNSFGVQTDVFRNTWHGGELSNTKNGCFQCFPSTSKLLQGGTFSNDLACPTHASVFETNTARAVLGLF